MQSVWPDFSSLCAWTHGFLPGVKRRLLKAPVSQNRLAGKYHGVQISVPSALVHIPHSLQAREGEVGYFRNIVYIKRHYYV